MTCTQLKPWQKYLVISLFAVGIVSRLWVLGEKAFHHDESIHCHYSYEMATEGRFKGADNKTVTFGYDPVYHGPFLYHFGGLIFFLFGDSDFTARLPYALAGIFLLWLVWETRRLVGVPMAIGMLAAVVLSPLVNYYTRFARNDVYIGTAFFAVAVYAALYLKEKRSGYLVLSAFFLAIGYSVKENSYIYGFSLGVFAVCWAIVRLLFHGEKEFRSWFTQKYPLVVLLALYACFSFFVFLFVAVDYWVDPEEHGFIGGVVDIASKAFESDKLEVSGPDLREKIQNQKRFFTDKDRSTAGGLYRVFAFLSTLALLGFFEFLRHWFCHDRAAGTETSKKEGEQPEEVCAVRVTQSDDRLIPLAFSCGLLFFAVVFLCLQSILSFVCALILWIAFETIRGDYLRLEEDKPDASRLLRVAAPWLVVASCLLVVVMVYVFLFSQMFADLPTKEFPDRNGLKRGIYNYIEYWFGHQLGEYRLWGPWWFYLARLLIYEYAFLLVSVVGLVVSSVWFFFNGLKEGLDRQKLRALNHPFHPFFVLLIWLAFFNVAIYSKLHEKTPWLAFHQALPWALVAGGFLGWGLATWRFKWFRVLVALTVIPLAALTVKAHIQVNFIEPDNINELVSQQQADRDIRDMVKMVDRLAAETGLYEDFPIATEDLVEWPFVWYFRNYNKYRVKTTDPNAMVQFGDDSTFKEMRAKLGDKFTYRKYLHRGAWIENQMGDSDLPGGTDLSKNISAYLKDERFKGKSFRQLFWDYFFHRERWSDINPKWGYAYFRKELLPTLEPIEVPEGTLDPPRQISADLTLAGPLESPDRFRLPRGLRFDAGGSLHVVDSLNGRVVVLDATGNFVRAYGSPGTDIGQLKVEIPWGPSSVAFDSEGNAFVADTWNNRIMRFDPQGKYVMSWGNGGPGTKATTTFFFPRGIEIGPDDLVYVADTGHHEIEVFKTDGTKVKTIGKPGLKTGQFDEPVGMKFGPDGNLYVADAGNERIQVFTANGQVRSTILVPGWAFDKVGMEPFIDFLSDGRIVTTLSRKNMFRIYAKDGKSAKNYKIAGGDTQPIGVAVGPDGKIWLADRTTNQVYRVSVPE